MLKRRNNIRFFEEEVENPWIFAVHTYWYAGGTGCTSSNSQVIRENFENEIKKQGLEKEVKVVKTGCFGLCEAGPVVIVYPEGSFYSHVKPEDVFEIVSEHLLKGRIVQRLLYKDKDTGVETSLNNIGFYKKQLRVALRNCGVINPEKIEEYIAFDGYKALGKVLTDMKPEDVYTLIFKSGFKRQRRRRFPDRQEMWEFASKAKSDKKYVICNADEGDPGAFMDRSVLEGDPHAVSGSHGYCRICNWLGYRLYLLPR